MSIPTQIAAASPDDEGGDQNNSARDRKTENSYNFIRFCAASAVLFSHHFDLFGYSEPLIPGYDKNFGELAVEIFFCLSGFLICRSLQKNTDWARFFAARVLRILPNLAVALAATSLVTLLWYHNYSHFWDHVKYVIKNLLMLVNGVTQNIPGVFIDAKRSAVNEPLWTLPYEMWAYVGLFVVFLFSSQRIRFYIVGCLLILSTAWASSELVDDFYIGPLESAEVFRFGSFFFSGAAAAVFWPWIRRYAGAIGILGLIGFLSFPHLTSETNILISASLAASVIGLGNSKVLSWFNRTGDASYGIYVFAWPLQQFCILTIGSFWLSMAAAFVAATAVGYGTWHLFEKRALSYSGELARSLRQWRAAKYLITNITKRVVQVSAAINGLWTKHVKGLESESRLHRIGHRSSLVRTDLVRKGLPGRGAVPVEANSKAIRPLRFLHPAAGLPAARGEAWRHARRRRDCRRGRAKPHGR